MYCVRVHVHTCVQYVLCTFQIVGNILNSRGAHLDITTARSFLTNASLLPVRVIWGTPLPLCLIRLRLLCPPRLRKLTALITRLIVEIEFNVFLMFSSEPYISSKLNVVRRFKGAACMNTVVLSRTVLFLLSCSSHSFSVLLMGRNEKMYRRTGTGIFLSHWVVDSLRRTINIDTTFCIVEQHAAKLPFLPAPKGT